VLIRGGGTGLAAAVSIGGCMGVIFAGALINPRSPCLVVTWAIVSVLIIGFFAYRFWDDFEPGDLFINRMWDFLERNRIGRCDEADTAWRNYFRKDSWRW